MQRDSSNSLKPDFKDPFVAGQMVGMLVMAEFLDNNLLDVELYDKILAVCAEGAGEYLEKPTEDVFLYIETLLKELK